MAEKEATIFVVDISQSMGKSCTWKGSQISALEWCLSYVRDKVGIKVMAARKTDYVAVVAVGSPITDHMIHDESNSYDHIRIILPFPARDSDELRNYTYVEHLTALIKASENSTWISYNPNCKFPDLIKVTV